MAIEESEAAVAVGAAPELAQADPAMLCSQPLRRLTAGVSAQPKGLAALLPELQAASAVLPSEASEVLASLPWSASAAGRCKRECTKKLTHALPYKLLITLVDLFLQC